VTLNVAGTECVLLRKDVYLRMDPDYDTRPWTIEEMNLLADEAEEMISRREAHERAAQLLAALDKARNTDSVGPLHREDIYYRNVLR